MRVAYISPSLLPSRAANAVHVVHQCHGLATAGASVTLYAKRTISAESALPAALAAAYGVRTEDWRLVTYYSKLARADNLRIAALAVADLARSGGPQAIVCRNIYAAFVLAVLRNRPLVFETHQLEFGFRKALQRAIMRRERVTTVVISQQLTEALTEHHGISPRRPLVLHDAAPDGMEAVPAHERRAALRAWLPELAGEWDAVCAYFGHLYPGRGIEIIESMSRERPRCLFLIFGGNEADIAARRDTNHGTNLRYLGHVPHATARRAMTLADVLLMPYQRSVSIGVATHDTARWMSPMKMFEYLGAGVPIISSDLPVLREVLRSGSNCLLVSPSEPREWVAALDRLIADPALASAIGEQAHHEYLERHTWTRRARQLLRAASEL